MVTKTVEVTIEVDVTVDEAKFTPAFMEEFRRVMYPLRSLDEHIEHLGQMAARELFRGRREFVEGYGHLDEMGISVQVLGIESDVVAGVSEEARGGSDASL